MYLIFLIKPDNPSHVNDMIIMNDLNLSQMISSPPWFELVEANVFHIL